MCDYAVFLSRLEFSVLLMAGGVEQLPCFHLPAAKDVDQRQMIEAVHGLALKGFVQAKDTGLCLLPEWSRIIETIKTSEAYLFVEPGDGYEPQRIVYLGSQAVVLENTAEANYDFRLFSKESANLWPWLEEAFGLPHTDIVSKAEAVELCRLSKISVKEEERLRKLSCPGSNPGIRFWMQYLKSTMGTAPIAGLRLSRSLDKAVCWDLVLFPGTMNLWFLWSHESSQDILPDSAETRDNIKRLFGREAE